MLECIVKNGWLQFLEFIQSRCTKAEFENWLAPIQLRSSTPEEIVLEVPNIFVQEYLLDNYKDLLQEFVPIRANKELALTFVIAPPKKSSAAAPKPIAEPIPESSGYDLKLNPTYRFENFIEGPSNQFVKSAALGVAARPGKTYNPLFIHGGVGLGKTHLLHAIGHSIHEEQKKLKIQAITTEAFINDIVDSLRAKSIDRMKRFYRTLDVLLVDDIQFLQNRLNFEEEFCNTFEILINQNKQIVITSDKPPSQLKLSERMVARMEWGLVAHMGIPDLETRVAIINQKAERKNLNLPSDVAFFIAEHIYHNVRQLEGAINRLCAHARYQGTNLTVETAERILNELVQSAPQKKISVDSILQSVAAAFEIRIHDLKGESRQKEIAFARQIAMYLAKEMIEDSLTKIASSFGGKTHSTLLHAWNKINKQLKENEDLVKQIQMIRRNIEQ
ncbi:MAG: dnaA2 [Parachlamydiales bacterium]|nr:dnaA2 [Parachlamydiales bacterium]